MAKLEGLNLLDYVDEVAKANIGSMDVDWERRKKQSCTIGKLLGGFMQAPMPNMFESFPVIVEKISHQEN